MQNLQIACEPSSNGNGCSCCGGHEPATFRDKFMKQCCKEVSSGVYVPIFYSGAGSRARPGHPASQNLAELAIKTLKEVVAKLPRSEQELMDRLEKRHALCAQCPSREDGYVAADSGSLPSAEADRTKIPACCCVGRSLTSAQRSRP